MNIVAVVHAQGVNVGSVWPIARIGAFATLGGLVSHLLPTILMFGALIFFVMIIIAGMGMIVGAGSDDAHAKEKAKNFLTYSVIGLIIMFAAYWILQIVNRVTGNALNNLFQ
jgi:uncharacterized membrane protein